MSDFPLGVTAPEGAQKLVGVCKGTGAVIGDRESELGTHNRAAERHTAAVEELNEMAVHINNAGEIGNPCGFSLGVREPACIRPVLAGGGPPGGRGEERRS
jgi:hypothetical protein